MYLDDVIMLGKSFKDHLRNLQGVFQRPREAGPKLKSSKCNLCQDRVSFLGQRLCPRKVFPRIHPRLKPSKSGLLQQNAEVQLLFLGFCNCYRCFIRAFATIAKPLHRFIEKTREFQWTADYKKHSSHSRPNYPQLLSLLFITLEYHSLLMLMLAMSESVQCCLKRSTVLKGSSPMAVVLSLLFLTLEYHSLLMLMLAMSESVQCCLKRSTVLKGSLPMAVVL